MFLQNSGILRSFFAVYFVVLFPLNNNQFSHKVIKNYLSFKFVESDEVCLFVTIFLILPSLNKSCKFHFSPKISKWSQQKKVIADNFNPKIEQHQQKKGSLQIIISLKFFNFSQTFFCYGIRFIFVEETHLNDRRT